MLSHKKITLFDISKQKEVYKKTDIQIFNSDTGELIFRGSNKIILPGAGFTARAHFELDPATGGGTEVTPNYNTALGLDSTVSGASSTDIQKCFLFSVGTDGCGIENSQVYSESYAHWCPPASLVPFKYQLKNNDLTDALRTEYFGRKETTDRFVYYFKAFDAPPVLIQQFTDGTSIDSNVYDTTKTEDVESYVEILLKITKDDCKDFFINTTGINSARINTISLLTGWAQTINGYTYYQDIRPLTKLNIPNEPLIDMNKGIDIVYHIYY